MTFYRVTPGQSPAMVARVLGTSVSALMSANRHKPTTVVAGRRTFQSLRFNELLHKPRVGVGALGADGTLGITPADPAAPHAMIRQGSSGADVALWQTIIGTTPDGSFGPNTAAATRAWQSAHGVAADGIVGPQTWGKALGSSSSAPVAVSTPSMPSAPAGASLAMAAGAAYSALNMDPNYCTSVAKSGTAVNSAVHNFKAAWNAANPGQAVPIGTGKYEPVVAAALSSALAGVTVPAGCGGPAVAPIPVTASMPSMPVFSPPPIVTPVPSGGGGGSSVPAAVLALASIDPCDQANAGSVTQAQHALGVSADGKYGNDTAAAARRLMSNAPAGCSPRPAWWTAPGSSNAPGSGGGAAPPAMPPSASAPPVFAPTPGAFTPAPNAPASGGGGGVVAPAATKGLSKGEMVAGAVGAAALVGLIAMAAMGKKTGHRGASGKRGKRGPAKHKKKARR